MYTICMPLMSLFPLATKEDKDAGGSNLQMPSVILLGGADKLVHRAAWMMWGFLVPFPKFKAFNLAKNSEPHAFSSFEANALANNESS